MVEEDGTARKGVRWGWLAGRTTGVKPPFLVGGDLGRSNRDDCSERADKKTITFSDEISHEGGGVSKHTYCYEYIQVNVDLCCMYIGDTLSFFP